MNPALIAAMNFMMNGFKRTQSEETPSKEFKEEIEKLNAMSLFESLEYGTKYFESINDKSKK